MAPSSIAFDLGRVKSEDISVPPLLREPRGATTRCRRDECQNKIRGDATKKEGGASISNLADRRGGAVVA
jgi:hypothetical protein